MRLLNPSSVAYLKFLWLIANERNLLFYNSPHVSPSIAFADTKAVHQRNVTGILFKMEMQIISKQSVRDEDSHPDSAVDAFNLNNIQTPLEQAGDSRLDQEVQAAKLYSPIKDWQTRIVKLHAGPSKGNLVLDLVVVDIILDNGVVDHARQEQFTYEALSYCWGEPVYDHHVTMNGTKHPVTQNLYSALQRVQRSGQARCLWIDALCVNQQDNDERSAQVRGMLEIFKKAERVLVWLGECNGSTEICLKRFASMTAEGRPDVDAFVQNCSMAQIAFDYDRLQGLFQKPWYTRVWVRQEIWAARKIVVYCGTCKVSWDLLMWMSQLASAFARKQGLEHDANSLEAKLRGLRQADDLTLVHMEFPELARQLYTHRAHCMQSEVLPSGQIPPGEAPIDLFSLVQAASHCECTDKRDYVYGVLGMLPGNIRERHYANAKPQSPITIDYSRSASQVFQDAAQYIIHLDANLDLLRTDAVYGGTVDGERLPSWCPDFSQPFGDGWNFLGRQVEGRTLSRASGGIRFQGSIMLISVVVVGSVQHTSASHYWSLENYATVYATVDSLPSRLYCHGHAEEGDVVVRLAAADWHYLLYLRAEADGRFSFQGWSDDRICWMGVYAPFQVDSSMAVESFLII